MKATGIVRRIDELGRVVIPKEIRSTLRLKSGDPILTTLKKQVNDQSATFESNSVDLAQNLDEKSYLVADSETCYILAMLALRERLYLKV